MSDRIQPKAVLIPLNSQKEIFIQDRRGFRKPDWGFFGGGIEDGETPLEAVIRETKEELNTDISGDELTYLGEFHTTFNNLPVSRHIFLYQTEQKSFAVLEGTGGYWMSLEDAKDHLSIGERFEEIENKLTLYI